MSAPDPAEPARGTEVAVVAPVYGNRATLPELHSRLRRALGADARLIFVDDASPDDSAAVVGELAAADPAIQLVRLAENVGQHRAVLAGLERARDARFIVVTDADLQDPPEAIPALLARFDDDTDVVFGGRRGAYQSTGRRLTSRMFKLLLSLGCGVPRDAGMFMILRGEAATRLRELEGPAPFLVAMVGRAGLRSASIPVERDRRGAGQSTYTGTMRLRAALRGLRWAFWGRLGGRPLS